MTAESAESVTRQARMAAATAVAREDGATQAAQRTLRQVRDLESQEQPVVGIEAVFDHGAQGMLHRHERVQFLHVVGGALSVRTQDGQWLVPLHHALLLPAGLAHGNQYFGPARVRSLYLAPSSWAGDPLTACRLLAVPPLLHELVASAVELPADVPLAGRDALLMALTVAEIQRQPALGLSLPMPSDRRLRRLCEMLLQDPGNNESLVHWTSRHGISRRTLARLFPRETGLSYTAWRQQLRLLAALERLAAGMPVSSVALDLGYGSVSAFGAMFLRHVGMPPSEYVRRQGRVSSA